MLRQSLRSLFQTRNRQSFTFLVVIRSLNVPWLCKTMASCEVPAKSFDFGPLDFPNAVDVNDDLPSEEALSQIAEYPLLDLNENQVSFRSICEGINGDKKHHKVLIIFIRHFFCGVRFMTASSRRFTSHLTFPSELSGLHQISVQRPSFSRRTLCSPGKGFCRNRWLRCTQFNTILRGNNKLCISNLRGPVSPSLLGA